MEAIAEQIRALIEANAPGLTSVTDGLPDVALIAAPVGALLIVLILLFMILGALGGGKKKKAARETMKRELEAQDDIPKPIPLRQPAAAAPSAPEPKAAPKAPELDRRGQQLLEALRAARAPDADPPSPEQRIAQEAAAARLVRDHGAVLRLIMSGESKNGFNKMAEEAGALEKKHPRKAAQVWRDLAVLTEGVNNEVALHAAECAHTLDNSDFWSMILLARLRGESERYLSQALDAAHAAGELAKGPREKAVAHAEIGDASSRLGRFDAARIAYKAAVDAMRSLARGGEARAQHDLSVCLNRLGDLEKATGNADAARALYDEDLAIARHLAKTAPSPDTERDVLITVVKLAEITNDKNQWQEARDIAEGMERAGRLPQTDAWILTALRERVASLG